MEQVALTRFAYTGQGVWGKLALPDGSYLYTVERPWLNNAPFVSCIPDGTYTLAPGFFHRGGYPAMELQGVPGRTLIKMHRANQPHELKGCIAPVVSLLRDRWPWFGVSSTLALNRVMAQLGQSSWLLRIQAARATLMEEE